MKKSLLLAILIAVALAASVDPLSAQPTVTGNNGVLGFNLNSYGRVRVGLAPYSTSTRQLSNLSFIAGLNQNAVYDYSEDSDSTNVVAQSLTIAGVDTAFICLTDSEFLRKFPKIKVFHTVMAWKNTNYVIVRFDAINDSTVSMDLYLGASVLPRPSGLFGGETVAYSADKKTGYFFRTGETPYWGLRLLSGSPSAMKVRDWDNYSPDPANDLATDDTRFQMASASDFDAPLTAGVNGSIYYVMAGLYTMAPNDTVTVYYAATYGTSLDAMLAASDSAQARYDIATSVEEREPATPRSFALYQNYPNPFNPSTTIGFDLPERSQVSLKLYDVLGREVRTLIDETRAPGAHRLTLDATGLGSGVYFYTLRAGRYEKTQKLLLVR
jgi:hypothetical protein